MHYNSFFKHILFACIIVLLASCDKDFNEIGSDIIGNDHFEVISESGYTVLASSHDMGPVQTNNLPINALGIYTDPVFGTTKAHFVTQLELESEDPTIGVDPIIESVILTVPYFSVKGETAYTLDSIYGPDLSKIKLSVYENGYYLRDLDPVGGFQDPQKYYSDQNADFFNAKGTLLNDSPLVAQNSEFVFSPLENEEIVSGSATTTKSAPGMKLTLNKDFFKTKIIEAPAGKLLSNNIFKEWLRGLYFHVENSGAEPGNLAMLNFNAGKITIKYKQDLIKIVDGVSTTTREDKTITLKLSGNSVNLLEYSNPVTQNPDKLYLKGGAGTMTVIDLFDAAQLAQLRADNWLINEANLTFYIDKTAMGTAPEPNRVYLYDLNNNRPLVIDYYSDNSTDVNPKLNKSIHGGIIEKETTGDNPRGIKYKIRLTNHIRNIIKKDSTNVRLGLVVTEDIREIRTAKLKNPFTAGSSSIDRVPLSSVINPLGTILFGSGGTAPEGQKLKLEIYYTKPN